MSLRRGNDRSEVLAFNSGGSGARAELDGMSATAFPSGVMTMPVEATEHAGPVIIWRKELRPDSGGAGRQRGGLGQHMVVGAREGWRFDISAMLDRVRHPARGRDGGGDGGATEIALDDGTPLKGKGRQSVPEGARVRMAFPGGGGYGPVTERAPTDLARDIARGYVTEDAARRDWGADDDLIETARRAAKAGRDPE
jgi:N-methylhydantoinase B